MIGRHRAELRAGSSRSLAGDQDSSTPTLAIMLVTRSETLTPNAMRGSETMAQTPKSAGTARLNPIGPLVATSFWIGARQRTMPQRQAPDRDCLGQGVASVSERDKRSNGMKMANRRWPAAPARMRPITAAASALNARATRTQGSLRSAREQAPHVAGRARRAPPTWVSRGRPSTSRTSAPPTYQPFGSATITSSSTSYLLASIRSRSVPILSSALATGPLLTARLPALSGSNREQRCISWAPFAASGRIESNSLTMPCAGSRCRATGWATWQDGRQRGHHGCRVRQSALRWRWSGAACPGRADAIEGRRHRLSCLRAPLPSHPTRRRDRTRHLARGRMSPLRTGLDYAASAIASIRSQSVIRTRDAVSSRITPSAWSSFIFRLTVSMVRPR